MFAEETEELADRVSSLVRVPEVLPGVDRIVVAASAPLSTDVAGLFEIGDDHLHRTLGDPNRRRDIAQPHVNVTGDDEKHPPVVRQKGPLLSHMRTLPREIQIGQTQSLGQSSRLPPW